MSPKNHTIDGLELTILLPCLNEAETLATCIRKARGFLLHHHVRGEVLVSDNGSTDGSQTIAQNEGARVVTTEIRGYGAALINGIQHAKGKYVIMGDADDSYDFENLMPFLQQLREGYDLVMGNRFKGGIQPGAMPALHKYIGNPVLSYIGRLFFNSPVRDFHCGLRGYSREKILALGLKTSGMEFASEMVVKATINGLKITEVPTTLSPDGRSSAPHLRSWRDGWRHLRFLLLFSPKWLFLYPGLMFFALGIIGLSALAPGPVTIHGITLDIHTMLYASLSTIVGLQLIFFAIFTRTYAGLIGALPSKQALEPFSRESVIDYGAAIGALLLFIGIGFSIYAVMSWGDTSFGSLNPRYTMRLVIPAATFMAIGMQLFFGAFFLGILRLKSL